jgi:hypothetical protein
MNFSAKSNLKSQTIIPARNEVEIAVVAEHLQLLPYLLLDVPIVGIKPASAVADHPEQRKSFPMRESDLAGC